MSDALLELAKGARALPPTLLAVWGVYGGQYARAFPEPYQDLAAMICLTAMVVGAFLLAFAAVRATFFPAS